MNTYRSIKVLILSAILFGGLSGVAQATKTQGDFNLSNRFSLEIDGVLISGVESIKNLEASLDVVEYKDGESGVTHTRPGNHKPGRITILKDWSNNSELYQWFKKTTAESVQRKSISVIFQNDAGKETSRMNFYNCWPVRWSAPDVINARNSGHASEKLEISWETMELNSK